MEKKKIFTVNLYGYLDEDKAKVCKNYQDRNKRIIENHEVLSNKYEYIQIDADDSVNSLVESESCIIKDLPIKYKYQMISDIVRYKFLKENPDSIFLDTDFCMFGNLALEVINAMSDSSSESGVDLLAGEMNKNRLFPCNWLMIGAGNENGGIFSVMYSTLIHTLSVPEYESYDKPDNSKWESKMESYIWEKLWGYAIPRTLDISKFSIIPYEYFQSSEWNEDWRSSKIMKKRQIVACHFFGFGEGGRPDVDEFIKYHGLESNV